MLENAKDVVVHFFNMGWPAHSVPKQVYRMAYKPHKIIDFDSGYC